MEQAYLASLVGSVQTVLFERGGVGHCGNYCAVRVAQGGEQNSIGRVEITGVDGSMLLGTLCS